MIRIAPTPPPYAKVRTGGGATSTEHRLVEWIDLTSDLLQRPQPEFPRGQIASLLNRTFSLTGVSWDWRDRSGAAGFESYPDMDVAELRDLPVEELLTLVDGHPLIRWFAATQDAKPQSTGRVPHQISPDRHAIEKYLKPVGCEQQLSIPYLLEGSCYQAFVLCRSGDDFDDADLELTARLQRLIRGLWLHVEAVARGPHAADSCAAADRIGLTATEQAVLTLVADGHTTYGVARRLQMAPRTAGKHLEHIYRKLGVTHRVAAVNAAHEAGLV